MYECITEFGSVCLRSTQVCVHVYLCIYVSDLGLKLFYLL